MKEAILIERSRKSVLLSERFIVCVCVDAPEELSLSSLSTFQIMQI